MKQRFSHVKKMRVVMYPYLLWSDGSKMKVGESSFHFVNIVPANQPLKHMRSKRGSRRLARLPVVDTDLG